ncbi:hypothetical protein L1047_12050 [Synechococcus sp. Nb3U1]|uniref:hypothetical protein n=1 Tax=Synechococcus sp. Nb3U1 TaxID=1914529 RepID=UPI001F36B51D|nr:hypothetical protein [Synechococcus sp. Nb3U1]MCF2971927.1 hypothetical protein [Synechococcus sp. Nb3U1]
MTFSLLEGFASALMGGLFLTIAAQPGFAQFTGDPVQQVSQSTGTSITWPQGTQMTLVDAAGDRVGYEVLQSQVEQISPNQALLKLTVRINNGKSFPVNFWNDSFRLRLGTDTLAPSNFLNEVVEGNSTQVGTVEFRLPNRPVTGFLVFIANDTEDQLSINLGSSSVLQATPAPTVVVSPPSGLRATLPQGGQITLVDAAGDRVGYEVLQSQVEQISPNQALLKLTVRINNGKSFPVNFWNDSFRLSWGGNTLTPSNVLNEVVQGNSTQTGEITFTIPNAVGSGSLGFNLNGVQDQLPLQVR